MHEALQSPRGMIRLSRPERVVEMAGREFSIATFSIHSAWAMAGTTMRNIKIQNVYQVTRGFERSLAFYGDVLGMKLKFRDGEKWAQFDANGGRFALSSPEEAGPAASSNTVIVFEVEDLAAGRAALEQAGAPILAVRDMGGHGSVLTARDPDGNVIQFFAKAARHD
jgi:predicted enzyme related to lactoylglutathione lyase